MSGIASGGVQELAGEQIRNTLAGNSIVHPDFGCMFYRPDGKTDMYFQEQLEHGTWEVRGDLYYSSGQCGEIGCHLSGTYPELIFRRIDGDYEQPVILILGNHCKKDGIVS